MRSVFAKSPARVNILGEHTDYNDGFVLPMSSAIFTSVTAKARDDRLLRVTSSTVAETAEFALDDLRPGDPVTWIDYIKGVAAELQQHGVQLIGADLEVDSEIPLGAGLSSSAALELSVAQALLALVDTEIAPPDLAKLCQRAEHNYAGVRCGIMDQYTLACAEKGHAILLDCRSLDLEQVPLPASIGFILTDSGVRHSLAAGEYNERADECAAAVALIAERAPRTEKLRDVSAELLEASRASLGDVLYRRCRHVLTENQRVLDAVVALKYSDVQLLGDSLNACHASLRDDFEVSCSELDSLVAAANSSARVFGSRMIGAGFGGCVLSVCNAHDIGAAAQEIRDNYAAVSGKAIWQHNVAVAAPARVIEST
jgi:galactokinase